MKKTVLVDARFVGSGSALGRYAENLLKHLLQLRLPFHIRPVLTTSYRANIPSELKEADPLWTEIPHYTFSEQLDLPYQLRQARPALIHYTHFNAPLFSPRPFLVTIHDLTITKFRDPTHSLVRRASYHLLLRFLAKKASHLIAVSNATKDDIVKILKVPEGKVSVIYEGVEEKFRPQPEEAQLRFREKFRLYEPYILYVGQWRPHKNLPRLIEAFNYLKRDYRIEEKLVFIGKKDPRYPEVPAKVKELGLEKEVRFLGFVEEEWLPCAYSSASLLVMPSLAEGFGFPPPEALACGTPVAASFIACLREVLDECAVFFDPYDPRDMAVKIYSALTNQKLRQILSARGRKWVKRYRWRKTAELTAKVYEEILAEN